MPHALSELITPSPSRTLSQGYREALQLSDDGVALERQRLRRQNPNLTETGIDALVNTWLQDRPPPLDGVVGFRQADPARFA